MVRRSLLCVLAIVGCRGEAKHPSASSRGSADTVGAVMGDGASADSAAQFARTFYDWYLHRGARFDMAMLDSASALAPGLENALRADFEAQAKDSEDIVGLDWDPFLNSQDPCSKYVIGRSSQQGQSTLVPVTGTCTGKAQPDAIVELQRSGKAWLIANVRHAADTGSLLSDLERLRQDRASHK